MNNNFTMVESGKDTKICDKSDKWLIMKKALLNDLLECSVCLEQLDSSNKVLPCQHTFCKCCLRYILNLNKELRCPLCRILVDAEIEELPCNIFLARLLESIRNNVPPKLIHNCTDIAPRREEYSSLSSQQPTPHPQLYQPLVNLPRKPSEPSLRLLKMDPIQLAETLLEEALSKEALLKKSENSTLLKKSETSTLFKKSETGTPNIGEPTPTPQPRKSKKRKLDHKAFDERTCCSKKDDACQSFEEFMALKMRTFDDRTKTLINITMNDVLLNAEMLSWASSGCYSSEKWRAICSSM